ncbi:MAG TPA: tetratricopeptide repeat protein [Opitutaceae bacterium]|nr:tetratricopeptide repeat protein [Opitutaceae bacterium]
MKSRITILVVAGIAAVGATGWLAFRASQTAAIVGPAVPEIPDLASVPSVLQDLVAAADARARSFWSARRGVFELSRLYHANGRLAEAVQCYEVLQQIEPEEARWPHLQATILAGFGQADEAAALWERVITLAPDYLPARLRLGDIQLKSNRPAEAAANYQEALRLKPEEPYALLGLARLDLEAERWEDARRRLEIVVAKTRYTLGYDLIVTLYERLGLNDRAAAIRATAKASGAYRDPADPWLDELIAECYDSYRIATIAGIEVREGRTAEGIELLRRAIEISPNDVSARFQLGTLAFKEGDIATAREQLLRCTTLAPGFSDGWAWLSDLQARQGEMQASERTLAEGLRNCPQSPGLHLMRARRSRDAGRTGEAIVSFQTSARLRPNEPDAYLELGTMLLKLGRDAEALRLFQRALDAEPGNPQAIGILSFAAISAGDKAEADRWMQQVRNQPRVQREQVGALSAAYQKQFGRLPD